MTDEEKPSPVADQVRKAVRTLGEHVHKSADPHLILASIHSLWLLVCGRTCGGSRSALAALAEAFPREAATLAAAYSSAPAIGALGRGWALLRLSLRAQADEAFAAAPSLSGEAGMISCVAKCGQAMAMALLNRHQVAKGHLAAARQKADGGKLADPGLLGLLGFTEALIQYRRGRYALVMEGLTSCLQAFRSPFASHVWDFPGFAAEVFLLQAKTFREMALYEAALDAVQDDLVLREQNDDSQGRAWALLEKSRILRFMSHPNGARRQLELAKSLLRGTDHWDLLARIEDQRGDVARAEGDLAEAEQQYLKAERLARNIDNRELRGHLANSRARLLEDQDRAPEALKLLRPHETTWRGTKGHGKYLYLMGNLHFCVGNQAEARRLLGRAITLLEKRGQQSYAALAHSRLAEVLLKQGKKEAACREWAAALRIAPRVQAEAFLEKIHQRIRELRAVDLLEVVSQGLAERTALQSELQAARAAAQAAYDRNFRERHALGHWFIRPISAHLWAAGKSPEPLPPVLREFNVILDSAIWSSQEFARSPAQPTEEIDVGALIKDLLPRAKDLGQDFQVRVPDASLIVWSHRLYLGQALLALFRGARTAFRVRQMRLLFSAPKGRPSEWLLRFAVAPPVPAGFELAARLVPLDAVGDDPKLLEFFKRGYTGDFTLLDFLVGVALWGNLVFDTRAGSINITLPNLELKENKHEHTE